MYLFTSVSSEEATQIKSTTSRTQIPRMRRLTLLRPCRPNIFSSVAQSNPSCMENMLKKSNIEKIISFVILITVDYKSNMRN